MYVDRSGRQVLMRDHSAFRRRRKWCFLWDVTSTASRRELCRANGTRNCARLREPRCARRVKLWLICGRTSVRR